MDLTTRVNIGHYNWLDTSQESVSIHLRIVDADGPKPINLSFPADEYNHWEQYFRNDPYWAAYEAMGSWKEHTLYSSEMDKVDAFFAFLKEHEAELELGITERMLKNVTAQVEALEKKRVDLMSSRDMLLDEIYRGSNA